MLAFTPPLAVRNVLEARLLWKIGNLNGLFQYFTFYEGKKGHPTGSQGSETKQKLGQIALGYAQESPSHVPMTTSHLLSLYMSYAHMGWIANEAP